jgi:hypothetical protein
MAPGLGDVDTEPTLIEVLSSTWTRVFVVHFDREQPVVLIVEDEFLIRMHAMDMIRNAGFGVVEARNADEAILILESRLDITVVFTEFKCRAPWMVSSSPPPVEIVGRQLKSWPPRDFTTFAKTICLSAVISCPSHIAPVRSSVRFAS